MTAMQSRRLRAVPDPEAAAFGALLCRLRTATLVTVARERERRQGGIARWTTQTTMSQNELARRAGLDPALINRLEAGTRLPGRATVEKLADALELDADDATLLLIAAGYWPWHALDEDTAMLVAQTAVAVIAGDYRRLEDRS